MKVLHHRHVTKQGCLTATSQEPASKAKRQRSLANTTWAADDNRVRKPSRALGVDEHALGSCVAHEPRVAPRGKGVDVIFSVVHSARDHGRNRR